MQAVEKLNQFLEYYRKNKLAHAYLVETNNIEKCLIDLKEVVKQINCNTIYKKDCKECNLCSLLENNYLPSFILIEADGKNIKKEQILDLKARFSSLPTYTKENIYVIKEAEKLNASSANTMLKFIEEPEEHIIGFFITNNRNNVINTIKSRCEIVSINYDESKLNDSILDSPYIELVLEYLKNIEENNNDSILCNRKYILNNYNDRQEIQNIFQLIFEIYKKSIAEKTTQSDPVFREKFNFLIQKNIEDLLKKEKITMKYLEEINYNVNVELFLDKFIIELSDKYE